MIDYETKVFTRVYDAAASLCAENMFVSTQVNTFAKLPAGVLYEMDNRTVSKRQSSTPVENYALITYQLEVYAGTKKTAKKVYSAADAEMIAMNFNRISGQFLPTLDNTNLVRYVARYEAVVDTEGNLYRP